MQSLENRALAQRQLGPNSKSGSSQWRGSTQVTGYTEMIRADVNRLPREVTSGAEHWLAVISTNRRLFVHVNALP